MSHSHRELKRDANIYLEAGLTAQLAHVFDLIASGDIFLKFGDSFWKTNQLIEIGAQE